MNRSVILVLLLLSSNAMTQPLRKGNRVILIRNIKTAKLVRITQGSSVLVIKTSGDRISGSIRLIKADTLFFKESAVTVADIDKIYFPSRFSFPDQPRFDENRPVYMAESQKYRIIIPPDTVYRSLWEYKNYLHRLNYRGRAERLKTFDPLVCNNFLKWNVSKLFHLELAFSYERKIAPKITWETELSGILGIPSADAHYTIDYPLYNYSGFSITTYPKFYFIWPTVYLSPVLMYRYLWVKGMRTDWPDGDSGSGELQDQYRNDLGLSIRIGTMRHYGKTVVDWYIGGGIKYCMVHQLVYGSYLYHDSDTFHWYNADHSANTYNQTVIQPVINLGIKIGRAF